MLASKDFRHNPKSRSEKMWKSILKWGGIIILVQCSLGRSYTIPPPEWITKTPIIEGWVCAVGASGPTLYREDGKRYAAEEARGELARTLGVRVYSLMFDAQTAWGSGTEQTTVVQATAFTSKVVEIGSQVREYWVDELGDMSGGQHNTTYALACLPLDPSQITSFMGSLIEELKEKGKDIDDVQAVRERAEEAFKELEREEKKDTEKGTQLKTEKK